MGKREIRAWDEMNMGEMKKLQQEMETLKYVASKATTMLTAALDKNKRCEAEIARLKIMIVDLNKELEE